MPSSDFFQFISDRNTPFQGKREHIGNGLFSVTLRQQQNQNSPLIIVSHSANVPGQDAKDHDIEAAKAIANAWESGPLNVGDRLPYWVNGVRHELEITEVRHYSPEGHEIPQNAVHRGLEQRDHAAPGR